MIIRRFTFGQDHFTRFPLPRRGSLADYWVEVEVSGENPAHPRSLFIEHFTSEFCPTPIQFAFEYGLDTFPEHYFRAGRLVSINEGGLIGTPSEALKLSRTPGFANIVMQIRE